MTRLPDGYEQLATELRQAAEREVAGAREAAATRRSLRSWASRHTLLAGLLVVGALGGTAAAAAVLTLSGEPSQRLNDRTPAAGGLADYRITIGPAPMVGLVGWCTVASVDGPGVASDSGGGGCEAAPVGSRHTLSSGLFGVGKRMMMFAAVDAEVGGVRLLSGRTVLARDEPGLPTGARVVITRLSKREERQIRGASPTWFLLGRDGQLLDEPPEESQRGLAPEQTAEERRGAMRASDPCRIRIEGTAGRMRSFALERPAQPVDGLNGPAFLACGRTVLGGDRFLTDPNVTVFVDAARPGTRPADLPQTGPRHADGTVEVPANGSLGLNGRAALAERRGAAWVVVVAPTESQRRDLLRRTTVENLPT